MQEILNQLYTFNIQAQEYLDISQTHEYEWKLVESFARQMISKNVIYSYGVELNIDVRKSAAIEFVFANPATLSKLIGTLRKIRKDILLTVYKTGGDANGSDSMFSLFSSLQEYLHDGHFDCALQPIFQRHACTPYGIIDLIMFSHLHKCRSFHRVIQKTAPVTIANIIHWYDGFMEAFQVPTRIDPHYLPKKEKHKQIVILNKAFQNPALFDAVERNCIEEFQQLIADGASLYSQGQTERMTILLPHLICLKNNIQFAKLLTQQHVNWECEDSDKMTPLFYAIKCESLEMIEYLIGQRVDLEHRDIQDRTPFYYACTQGKMAIIRLLQSHGVNINAKTALGRTAFSKASFLGLFQVVEFLIGCQDIDIHFADNQGRDALHNAAFGPKGGRNAKKVGTWGRDSPEIAQLLLENGMNPESNDKDDNKPLHVAASSEALDSIPVLIAFGASVVSLNKWGETPLMVAAKFGHIDTIRLLVEQYGADCMHESPEGLSMLEIAARAEQLIVFQYAINAMKPQLLGMQQLNKLRLQCELQALMEQTKELKCNPYVREYLRHFNGYINYETDHLMKIFGMKDCQVELLRSYCQCKWGEAEVYLAFETGLRMKDMTIFKELVHLGGDRLQYLVTLKKSIIDQLFMLQDDVLNDLLFNYNVDWKVYQSMQGETFLHKLVEKRKTTQIVRILETGDLTQEYIEQATKYNCTALELAVIHKHMDIYTLLDNYMEHHFKSKQGHKYRIPQYTVELLQVPIQYAQQVESSCTGSFNELLQFMELNEQETIVFTSEHQQCILTDKQLVYVDKLQQLEQCLDDLHKYSIMGVDVEFYTDRKNDIKFSLVCTIQISTIHTDYVLDITELREHKQLLQELFWSKQIKIFHGCDADLRVLYCDLQICVRNLVDTSKLELKIGKQQLTKPLQLLCKEYLGLHIDKGYQTSDWRIRPLPSVMLQYARMDAACLLLLFPVLLRQLDSLQLKQQNIDKCTLPMVNIIKL